MVNSVTVTVTGTPVDTDKLEFVESSNEEAAENSYYLTSSTELKRVT